MTEIKLRADDARAHAEDVRVSKEDVSDVLTQLRTRMDNLVDSFTGKTHERYIERLDEWKATSDELLEALAALGEFLKAAATAIESLDEELSGQLG